MTISTAPTPGGPFRADIVAVGLDLSDWGVPLGGVVQRVQFVGLTNEVDPIGFGSLIPSPATVMLLVGAAMSGGRRRAR